jgi:hypothetical protein
MDKQAILGWQPREGVEDVPDASSEEILMVNWSLMVFCDEGFHRRHTLFCRLHFQFLLAEGTGFRSPCCPGCLPRAAQLLLLVCRVELECKPAMLQTESCRAKLQLAFHPLLVYSIWTDRTAIPHYDANGFCVEIQPRTDTCSWC